MMRIVEEPYWSNVELDAYSKSPDDNIIPTYKVLLDVKRDGLYGTAPQSS